MSYHIKWISQQVLLAFLYFQVGAHGLPWLAVLVFTLDMLVVYATYNVKNREAEEGGDSIE